MIPIITFHAVGEADAPVFISPETFEAQLAALVTSGYRTVPLTAVFDWLKGGPPLPQHSIVLTFDDAYQSVFTQAFPRLQAHGLTATLFVITSYVGKTNRWPGQPASVPERPLMTWAQIERLAGDGWEIGAHTCSHPVLPMLPPDQAEVEIVDSQTAIARHTGQPCRAFAQPYGASSAWIDALVRRQFEGAASVQLGLADTGSNPYTLPRVDAFYWHPRLIPHMKRPSFRLYLALRRILRRIRRRVYSDWAAPPAA